MAKLHDVVLAGHEIVHSTPRVGQSFDLRPSGVSVRLRGHRGSRRWLAIGVLAGVWSLGWPSPASAQVSGFAVEQLEPADPGSEAFALDTLDFRGQLRPAIGLVADWAHQPLAIYDPGGSVRTAIVKDQLYAHLGGSLVLWERLRVGLTIPVQLVGSGEDGTLRGVTYHAPSGSFAFSDIRLAADVRLTGNYGDPFRLAVGARAWLPTGDQPSYAGDGSGRVGARILAAGDVGLFTYAADVGVTYRGEHEVVAGGALGSDLVGGAFAGVRVAGLVAGPELVGRTVLANDGAFKKRSTPFELLFGAHYQVVGEHSSVRIGAGVGPGLTQAYGTPSVRGLLSVAWSPAAPAPVRKASRAPNDQDGDGILDDDDACPDVPGVKTDSTTTNGCPADRDKDGIPDNVDACPDVPGIKMIDPKKTGCPPDSDGDGVIDADDVCPDVPGIKTDDPKTNGCPPPDADKDGIPDANDACPTQPGRPDPDPQKNGCPERVVVKPPPIRIADQVRYAPGSAAIAPGAEGADALERVRALLEAHPEIRKVRVEGHADTQEAGRAARQLSVDRAGIVMRWLVAHKIAASRLMSEGFGSDKPQEPNDTPDGRKANRRVEFQVTEQVEPAAPPPPPANDTIELDAKPPPPPKPH